MMEEEAIEFTAEVYKVQTIVDGGVRLTLDLQESGAQVIRDRPRFNAWPLTSRGSLPIAVRTSLSVIGSSMPPGDCASVYRVSGSAVTRASNGMRFSPVILKYSIMSRTSPS